MALIVEDGTGLSAAESYISVADAITYITAYKGADTIWDASTEAQKEVAARQATQYIDGLYSWKGVVLTSTQALDWPREGIYDERDLMIEGIPTNLKNATAEVMFLAINGESLVINVDRSRQTIMEKVDVIEIEYEVGASQQTSYPTVSRLLGQYIISSGRIQRG